ncbi:hypothetical protein GCK72_016383 [Caenorhabditis remanei]|uniref:Uncharacterized protein n=1 Tax=Caenorhabditis remanei TaxID=31234 RepID=A0A6A5G499_CAERE|nr:hypothetical protein GCK72_016383 [Caenorhabditis remanei]KAF1749838.1 hypothetical protein GCK72_016383 [Caenorhabditis remanei]
MHGPEDALGFSQVDSQAVPQVLKTSLAGHSCSPSVAMQVQKSKRIGERGNRKEVGNVMEVDNRSDVDGWRGVEWSGIDANQSY